MRNAAARSKDYGVPNHPNDGAFDMAGESIDAAEAAAKRARQRAMTNARVEKWRAKNPEKRKAMDKAYLLNSENLERRRAAQAKWRAEHREYNCEVSAKWRVENRTRDLIRKKAYLACHPERAKAASAKSRAKRLSAEGRFTASDIRRMIVDQRGKCAYCRKPFGSNYHIDHIIPLAKGGTNWPKNLQITCDNCNRTKHTAHPIEFARKFGMLL